MGRLFVTCFSPEGEKTFTTESAEDTEQGSGFGEAVGSPDLMRES